MDIARLGSDIPQQVKKSSSKRKLPPIRLKPALGSFDEFVAAQDINIGGLGMPNLVDPSHPVYDRPRHAPKPRVSLYYCVSCTPQYIVIRKVCT